MIKVSVLYPNQPGRSFDMDYYVGKHIPMGKRLLGDACKGSAVEQGLAGGALGAPATYAAMARALGAHGERVERMTAVAMK